MKDNKGPFPPFSLGFVLHDGHFDAAEVSDVFTSHYFEHLICVHKVSTHFPSHSTVSELFARNRKSVENGPVLEMPAVLEIL